MAGRETHLSEFLVNFKVACHVTHFGKVDILSMWQVGRRSGGEWGREGRRGEGEGGGERGEDRGVGRRGEWRGGNGQVDSRLQLCL